MAGTKVVGMAVKEVDTVVKVVADMVVAVVTQVGHFLYIKGPKCRVLIIHLGGGYQQGYGSNY